MNKLGNIAVTIAITAFIATNAVLLFGDKSSIPKYVYVHGAERMVAADYSDKLAKESLVVPGNVFTAYVDNDSAVQQWLVQEGDPVSAGQEIATLNSDRAESQRSVWESERNALKDQESELESTKRELEQARRSAKSGSTSKSNRTDNVGAGGTSGSGDSTGSSDKVEVGLNVDVNVDVSQDGAYAHALSAVENALADVQRQLIVVEAQLEQSPTAPALVSPVDGVVAEVHRLGERLAVDIYTNDRQFLTYATGEEWQDIAPDDRVFIQAPGTEGAIEGTVVSVSPVEAPESKWLDAYRALDKEKMNNPLAYYEVRIAATGDVGQLPFANNANAIIHTEEAPGALAVRTDALDGKYKDEALATIIDENGYALKVPVMTPFESKGFSIVTDGLYEGDLVIDAPHIEGFPSPPAVILPMPLEWPSKATWKSTNWQDYVRYTLFGDR
ncbi:biotin/lipoyl-binding protein [Bhargavaea cecembensis]|uniref:biotin/lipoyl-binding protein n=1 Tax=Bhargavaea cecembensis TaxID=394098 RepID=UPI000590CF3D|nr:biotin/lipoyl-binding protein [Bhargavaea cecembensis]